MSKSYKFDLCLFSCPKILCKRLFFHIPNPSILKRRGEEFPPSLHIHHSDWEWNNSNNLITLTLSVENENNLCPKPKVSDIIVIVRKLSLRLTTFWSNFGLISKFEVFRLSLVSCHTIFSYRPHPLSLFSHTLTYFTEKSPQSHS